MLENKETPFGGLNEHAGDNFGPKHRLAKTSGSAGRYAGFQTLYPDVTGRYVNNKK